MFEYNYIPFPSHRYSLSAVGIKFRENGKEFLSRQDANECMYKVIDKNGLTVRKVWHDNHDVTFVCNNNVSFFVHRV